MGDEPGHYDPLPTEEQEPKQLPPREDPPEEPAEPWAGEDDQ
jgi:hypothetical protein